MASLTSISSLQVIQPDSDAKHCVKNLACNLCLLFLVYNCKVPDWTEIAKYSLMDVCNATVYDAFSVAFSFLLYTKCVRI